jgi:hypothetical protein
MWGPIWDAAAQWNENVIECTNALSAEMQEFLRRRTQENLSFAEEVQRCRTPADIWSAYAKYCQAAAEDLTSQSLAIDKRMRMVIGKPTATLAGR